MRKLGEKAFALILLLLKLILEILQGLDGGGKLVIKSLSGNLIAADLDIEVFYVGVAGGELAIERFDINTCPDHSSFEVPDGGFGFIKLFLEKPLVYSLFDQLIFDVVVGVLAIAHLLAEILLLFNKVGDDLERLHCIL